jgi:hypothetical protein
MRGAGLLLAAPKHHYPAVAQVVDMLSKRLECSIMATVAIQLPQPSSPNSSFVGD